MPKDRSTSAELPSDQKFVKQQMKAIRDAKRRGNEARAQRLADNLFQFLGWD